MSFVPVMLWSDALVFLLLLAGIASAWYVRQREHLLLPWRRVATSSVEMCIRDSHESHVSFPASRAAFRL